jgi:hypothetical protein
MWKKISRGLAISCSRMDIKAALKVVEHSWDILASVSVKTIKFEIISCRWEELFAREKSHWEMSRGEYQLDALETLALACFCAVDF